MLLGDSAVGKTCLIQRFYTRKYTDTHAPNINMDFVSKCIKVGK